MVNQLSNLEQALVAGNRVFQLLDEKGEEVREEKVDRFAGNVTFDHVYFGYQEGEYVLKDIDFVTKQGETVALVGHTGSGKSSIMNILFRVFMIASKERSGLMVKISGQCLSKHCVNIWGLCYKIHIYLPARLLQISV